MKKAIITGITGQDGAYLARHLLQEGYGLIGLVRNIYSFDQKRLKYLGIDGEIEFLECDLTDAWGIIRLLQSNKVDEIYNLASQSSVGRSFAEPISTLKFNSDSVLNFLEAIRTSNNEIKFYQASSSEMYGSVNTLPINEQSVMHPVSPYAISKATAYWTTVCYRESYSIYASNGILFNHESFLRGDNFFMKKVIKTAIDILDKKQDSLRIGNLDVKRDFGYAPDYVVAMHKLMQLPDPQDVVISSGKSVSLRDIVYYVFDSLGIDRAQIVSDESLYRPNDIPDIYGDNSKARRVLNWDYSKDYRDLIDALIEEELKNK